MLAALGVVDRWWTRLDVIPVGACQVILMVPESPHISRAGVVVAERLKVDLQLLRETGEALEAIALALRQADANARVEQGVLSGTELADAVREFADNWRVRRRRLVDAIDHRRMVVDGALAYQRADEDLAEPARSGLADRAGGP
jgi:nucleotide-binding universal stress UspA family protein